MIDNLSKYQCTGCSACLTACPKQAISMYEDYEGFLYPQIDYRLCVKCHKCDSVCESIKPLEKTKSIPKVYGAIARDENMRLSSSSGGVFPLLAQYILSLGGIVFGAAFDSELNVVHIGINSVTEINKLQGSKYVQSRIGNVFYQIKNELEKGRYVLFVGTSCQVNGLLHFLSHLYEKLFTVDFICHGVPSPKVWREYLKELTCQYGNIINPSQCTFRSKKTGWLNYSISIPFKTPYYCTKDKDPYLLAFSKNLCLRPSCYSCNAKGISRNSDITLADFWAIKKFVPHLFDDKGASLIFIHSEKGKYIVDKEKSNLELWKVDLEKLKPYIVSAYSSVKSNKYKREKFMKMLGEKSMNYLVRKYGKDSYVYRIKVFIMAGILKIMGKKAKWD